MTVCEACGELTMDSITVCNECQREDTMTTPSNDKPKWREFWIGNGGIANLAPAKDNPDFFHVIERAALTAAEAEIARLEERCIRLSTQAFEAEREIERLKQIVNAINSAYKDACAPHEQRDLDMAALTKENAELKKLLEPSANKYYFDQMHKHWDECNALTKQNEELTALTQKNALILEEQAKEIALLRQAARPILHERLLKANEIIAVLEGALKFYAETNNWPYAEKGKCPGELANAALAKLSEFRGKK